MGTGGRSSAAIFAGCSSSPRGRRGSDRPFARGVLQLRAAAPVQRERHPVLAFDEHPGQLPARSDGGPLHHVDVGRDARVGHDAPSSKRCNPYCPTYVTPSTSSAVTQERDGSAAHDRDAADLTDERGDRVTCGRATAPRLGVVDDRRDRTVEVDEDRGRGACSTSGPSAAMHGTGRLRAEDDDAARGLAAGRRRGRDRLYLRRTVDRGGRPSCTRDRTRA